MKKLYEPRLRLCRRLSVEFLHYVIASGALKKCFISVKGYYFQVEIRGEIITWIVPHKLGHKVTIVLLLSLFLFHLFYYRIQLMLILKSWRHFWNFIQLFLVLLTLNYIPILV